MVVIAVDDERPMLNMLVKAIVAAPEISYVEEFTSCKEALAWVEKHPIDIAFLDVSMRGMGGLTLAEKICAMYPNCKIIFCTGYEKYAFEAFRIHATGYLLKPITEEAVQQELKYILEQYKMEKGMSEDVAKCPGKRIRVQCYGNFDLFVEENRVTFKRSKAKELLAYLVYKKGSSITTAEAAAVLFEDKPYNQSVKSQIQTVISSLRATLKEVHAEELLERKMNSLSVNISVFDCDLYEEMNKAGFKYLNDYLQCYSWF